MKNKNKKCIVKPTGSNSNMYTSLCREKREKTLNTLISQKWISCEMKILINLTEFLFIISFPFSEKKIFFCEIDLVF